MIAHDQWREDMYDGVDLWVRDGLRAGDDHRLHKSINATSDPERMKDDTIFRTGGVIGRNNAERINGIAESFHQLNRGRDSG